MKERFGHGLVIGKFLPPHAGHHFLIETALGRSKRVTVIVCAKPGDPVPGQLRARWIEEEHPGASVMCIDDRYDENDSRVWAENTIRWLGKAPDAVFTSEGYGDQYARHLGCEHVLVDQARTTVPCSGTAVRNDPAAMWAYLRGGARSWYARRIVVLGAESTGTTTLSRALAEYFGTCWVPEYGREYSERKAAAGEVGWRTGEFLEIAREQTRREDAASRACSGWLICDTNAFATILWHRRYMGFRDASLEAFGRASKAHLYILTGDEIPFVQDGLRDGEFIRSAMQDWFRTELESQPVPWIEVRGSPEERLARAVDECRRLPWR